MALPLYDNALEGIQSRYFIDPVYDNLNEQDVLDFDKNFLPKEKYIPVPISVLLNRLEPDAEKVIIGLGCINLDDIRVKSEREISALAGINACTIETIRTVMLEHNYRWGEPKSS